MRARAHDAAVLPGSGSAGASHCMRRLCAVLMCRPPPTRSWPRWRMPKRCPPWCSMRSGAACACAPRWLVGGWSGWLFVASPAARLPSSDKRTHTHIPPHPTVQRCVGQVCALARCGAAAGGQQGPGGGGLLPLHGRPRRRGGERAVRWRRQAPAREAGASGARGDGLDGEARHAPRTPRRPNCTDPAAWPRRPTPATLPPTRLPCPGAARCCKPCRRRLRTRRLRAGSHRCWRRWRRRRSRWCSRTCRRCLRTWRPCPPAREAPARAA